MSDKIIFIIAILLIFVPFAGVPQDWKDWFVFGIGFLLIVLLITKVIKK